MNKGRPRGRANRRFKEAVEVPAACPRCGSIKLTRLRGQPKNRVEQRGFSPVTGAIYAAVEWYDKLCECGQAVRVRIYAPR